MSHEDTRTESERIDSLLSRAYDIIKKHEIDEAAKYIEDALSIDFDNVEVVTSLKYVNFWKDRQVTAREIQNSFERGEYLLGQWKLFEGFVARVGQTSQKCLYALRQHVFGEALDYYLLLLKESDGTDAELLLRIGRCYKGTGEYDRALTFLQQAASLKREDSVALAELADCYAMVNEIQKSKAFFREAFFLGPERIDVASLESEMIGRLVAKVRELGYESPALEEWLPVYAVLFGVFNVKRELRSIEYGKLKQSIYALERDYNDQQDPDSVTTARLMNRYFWLIDHYVNTGEDRTRIDEVLLKIKSINPRVYQQYTN